jgi:hypothetical protein
MPAAPTNVVVSPLPMDASAFVTWTLSTDDGTLGGSSSSLAGYNGDISFDNGVTWQAFFGSGSGGGNSGGTGPLPDGTTIAQKGPGIGLDTSSFPVTTTAIVRVRYTDGNGNYSTYAQSAVFGIVHGPASLIVPQGGETFAIGVTQTLRWAQGYSPSYTSDLLKYHLQISTNAGGTWTDIVALTAAGALTYSYNFAGLPVTGQALFRIQWQDPGGTFSGWRTSGFFSLITEVSPTPATNLLPNNGTLIDSTVVNRFSWQFNCLGDVQLKFDFKYSTDGGSTWTTVTQTSANPYYDAPASTFSAGALIWKVITYNQASTASPDSAQANITVTRKPATPVITSPTNGGTVTAVRPTVTWTYTSGALDAQVVFTLRVTDSNGVELWNSGPQRSLATSMQVGIDMANGTTRLFKLTIQNKDGFTSLEASNSATISLSVPPQPTIVVNTDPTNGFISVQATNPAGAPAAVYNELWRVDVATGVSIRLPPAAKDLVAGTTAGRALNGTYNDYQAASAKSYKYFVRAYAVTGTYTDSAQSSSKSLTLSLLFLHDVANPSTPILALKNVAEQDIPEYQNVMVELKGNPIQSVALGPVKRRTFRIGLKMIPSATDWQKLQALYNTRPVTLCCRDAIGTKVFAALGKLPAQFAQNIISGTIELQEVQYSEGV